MDPMAALVWPWGEPGAGTSEPCLCLPVLDRRLCTLLLLGGCCPAPSQPSSEPGAGGAKALSCWGMCVKLVISAAEKG